MSHDSGATPTDLLGDFINASLGSAARETGEDVAIQMPFLLFQHGARWFGVRAEAVSIVVSKTAVTRVPAQVAHLLGVALIRSRLVPVIDLAQLLGTAERPDEDDPNARLVVMTSDESEIAIVADEARGAIHLRADDMDHKGAGAHGFITAEIKWRDRMVSIIDTHALLAAANGEGARA